MCANPDRDSGSGGYYLYGFGAAKGIHDLPRIRGVADAPVEVVEVGGLAALLSPVPEEQFNERALAAQLDDLDWLETTTRTHERVLQEAIDRSEWVVPVRFCTVYESREALADFLTTHEEKLLALLERLEGKHEWGVKMLCQTSEIRARLRATDARFEPLQDSPRGGQGQSYLTRKMLERTLEDAVEQAQTSTAATSHRRLADASEDQALHSVARDKENSDSDTLLNSSYLVAAGSTSAFLDLIGALERESAALGMSFHVTGPWPPYSFARLHLS